MGRGVWACEGPKTRLRLASISLHERAFSATDLSYEGRRLADTELLTLPKTHDERSCTPTLRIILLAQRSGKMPPSYYALEGARPWFRLGCTTNSPYSFSCGSSSCCTSRGPSQICPPHPYQRSPSAP